MKSTLYQKFNLFFVLAIVIVSSTLLCSTALAENNNETMNIATTGTLPPDAQHPKIVANDKTNNQKESHPNEKRELSSFFKIGIGLNIIMLMVFVYWAVGQWRQNKK